MNESDELMNTLRQLEVELHDPAVRSSERASQLLADEFVEFGSSGRIYAKANDTGAACRRSSGNDFRLAILCSTPGNRYGLAHLRITPPCFNRLVLPAQFYLAASKRSMAHRFSPRQTVRATARANWTLSPVEGWSKPIGCIRCRSIPAIVCMANSKRLVSISMKMLALPSLSVTPAF
jgi:hypothetical protein